MAGEDPASNVGSDASQPGRPAEESVASHSASRPGERRVGPLVPVGACDAAATPGVAVVPEHVVGHVERLVGQTHELLGPADGVVVEGQPVGCGRVEVVGGGVGDVAAQDDERRSILGVTCGDERTLERVEVLGGLAELLDVPAVGLEPADGIVAQRQLGRSVDRDVVVVVDVDQPPESEVTRQRGCLVADPLGEVAVGDQCVDVVVDDVAAEAFAQRLLGERHADPVRRSPARAGPS